jgi:biotin carboxyl carrier protein
MAMAQTIEVTINGKTYTVEIGDVNASPVEVVVNGERKTVTWQEAQAAPAAPVTAPAVQAPAPAAPAAPAPAPQPAAAAPAPGTPSGAGTPINAPMPGKVLSVRVAVGDQVKEGDTVCTLEAMKMEMPISSSVSGTVTEVVAKVGMNVQYDDPLIMVR